jgi:hypothetical protein
MTLPADLWPSDTEAFFGEDYDSSTGDWNDDKAAATKFSQASSGSRPAEDTSTAPSGRMMLHFDGSNDQLSGGNIPTGNLATWSGSGFWVEFCIVKRDTAGTGVDEEHIVNYNGSDLLTLFFGTLYRNGANGDATLGTGVARLIVVHDVANTTTTLYVNGTAQSDTGTASSTVRAEWVDLKYVGNRNNGSQPFDGLIGCLGYIQRSTFGSTEVGQLDDAMEEWWTTAEGGGATTYSLLAQSVAIGVSGPAAGLTAARKLTAAQATLRYTGLAAALNHGYYLQAQATAYGYTGRTANLNHGFYLQAQATALGYTGRDANFERDLILAAQATAYGYTGRDAALNHGFYLAASATSLSFAAQAAGLTAQRYLAAEGASYTFTGRTAALNHGYYLAAQAASLALTGQSVTLTRALILAASSASLAFTGNDASFIAGDRLAADAASYTFTGNAASLLRGEVLAADAASYTFTGRDVNLTAARVLTASALTIAFAGQSAEIRRRLAADALAITYSSSAAELLRALMVVADSRSITFEGRSASFTYDEIETVPEPVLIRWTQQVAARIVVAMEAAALLRMSQAPAARITWRQEMSILHVGDVNRITMQFYDTDAPDTPLDPTGLVVVVVSPSGTRTTYTYGTDDELVRIETGKYRLSVTCDEAKGWAFTITASGNVTGVETGSFNVTRVA